MARGNKFIEDMCNYIANAQAEISFEAGIKDVVETVKYHSEYDDERRNLILPLSWWNDKLKEWNIET